MKSKKLHLFLIAVWILFMFLDGAGAIFRAWYLRKMAVPFRFFYMGLKYGRAGVLFALAILNFLLLVKIKGGKTSDAY